MKPHAVLKKYLVRKQKANPSYSMRAAARDLKVDASFLSRVLNGKKSLPTDSLDRWIKVFDLDTLAAQELKAAIVREVAREIGLKESPVRETPVLNFEDQPASLRDFNILSPWYNLFVLDLITCVNFLSDVRVIAKRLQITVEQARLSLRFLEDNGYIRATDNGFEKTDIKIRWPTKSSLPIVRQFHKALMERAVKEMFQHDDPESFAGRMITSASIAVNPAQLPAAKELLQKTHLELVELLSEGDCTEVYDLSMLLFPISRS